MSNDPKDARRRSRAVRRSLALAAALLVLTPVADALASRAFTLGGDQLWVVEEEQDRENTIVLEYDAQGSRFLIADESGIDPSVACAVAALGVACPDPDGLVREIYIVLGGGDDVFSFSEESDPLPPQLFETIISAGGGNDVVAGGPGRNRILGEDGRDVLAGGGAGDKLVGGGGRDGLIGFGGDDLIQGGQGADAIFGFGGDDILQGGTGSDTLLGGRGDDRLLGGPKHDLLEAGKGVDVLLGETGRDRLLAKDGIRDRRIHCGPGKRERLERDRFDPRARSC
jgi:hypothetical protein